MTAVDAFSGDSIPLHLITREAVTAYWRSLSEGGMLAFHISNPYLDLAPILAGHAKGLGAEAWLCYTDPPAGTLENPSVWVLIGNQASPCLAEARKAGLTQLPPDERFHWTDESINIFQVVRPEALPEWMTSRARRSAGESGEKSNFTAASR